MKELIRFFLLIILFGSELSLQAQTGNLKLTTSQYFEAPLIGRSYYSPPKGNGSPYLYDEWLNGYVVMTTGDTVGNRLFKLDCYKNELVWMADGRSLVALDHELIKSFTLFPTSGLTERKFEKTSLKLPFLTDTLIRYLEILGSGKINLYSFRRVAVYTEPTIGNKGGLYQMSIYEREPLFYIQIGNLPVRQVRFSKRSLIGAYPEYSAELKKILRENHAGGIKNEFQLISAVKLINQYW